MSGTTEQLIDHDEFDSLTMMLEWFRLEWPEDSEATSEDVIEPEEDYELEEIGGSETPDLEQPEEISQPELSSTEV